LAKAVIADELASRGYSDDRLAGWLPPAAQTRLPLTANFAGLLDQYQSMVRSRAWKLKAIRWLAIPVTLAFVVTWSWQSSKLLYGALVLPVFILLWLTRRRSLQILLLRPFGEGEISAVIARFVRNHLGLQATVITLEDRYYKPKVIGGSFGMPLDSFTLGTPLHVVYQLFKRSPSRLVTVRSERSYLQLALLLARAAGSRTFLTGSAFSILSTNAWWQRVVDLLIDRSDFIVMDVSRIREGSGWEIDRLEERGLLGKCIFVVQSGYEGDSVQDITRLLPATLVPELFVYERNGSFVDAKAFNAALARYMETALSKWGAPDNREPSMPLWRLLFSFRGRISQKYFWSA
jgi:hypothetical protein